MVFSNEKLTGELSIVRYVNTAMKTRIIQLEKCQAKAKQYSQKNNVVIDGTPDSLSDQDIDKNCNRDLKQF